MADIILFQPKGAVFNNISVPTGLLFLASKAVENGYKVKIIDQRINENWKEELSSGLSSAKLVYFSVLNADQLKNMIDVSKFVIKTNPNIQTIFGGEWVKMNPGLGMQDHNMDFVSYGDEDNLLVGIMDSINGKKRVTEIFDILYRPPEGAKINRTNPNTNIANIDDLPKLPWELIDLKYYLSRTLVNEKAVEIQFNKGARGFSVNRIIKELETLSSSYGIRNFFIIDELAAKDNGRLLELVDALSGKNYNYGLGSLDADLLHKLNDDSIKKLVNHGCRIMEFNLGSGNKRMLETLHKNITPEFIAEKNRELGKYQLIVDYKFKGGYPTESKAEFMDTLNLKNKLLKENNLAKASVEFYIPEPNTEMYQTALSSGYISPRSLKDWNDNIKWYETNSYWLTKEMVKLIEKAALISNITKKSLFFKIYNPIAKLRKDKNMYGFMIEKYPLKIMNKPEKGEVIVAKR